MTSLSETSLLAGASGQSTGYTINQSIRFNYGDSPYMYRSASSTGNRKKFTNSFWYKRGAKLGDYQALPSVHTTESGGSYGMYFSTADVLHVFTYYSGSWAGLHYSNQVFRDVSAWYHFVWAVDTTEVVASERVRIFVNGERITSWSSESYPSLNQDTSFNNSGEQHNLGKDANGSYYVDGYGAEMHYIDGYAYGPEYFGEFKEDTDIWIPKEYTGSYGTNGFYIKGSDSSALGTDSSGNGNNLTVSGLATNDQVTDTPTNNFCTLNPLDERGSGTLSNGNLQMAFGATNDNVTATQGLNTGKWYWEVYIVDKDDPYVGVQDSGVASTGYTQDAVALWLDGGYIYEDGSDTSDRSTTYANGDIVGVAFDVDNKKIWWSKNGQWYSADDSSTATINISEVEAGNQAQVITRSPDFFMPFVGNYNTGTVIMNFGQEGTFAGNVTAGGNSDGNGVGNFKYSVPSGYLALCTKNLGS